jgi:uncharacterized membrane protein HdeD (DUF308 family)
MTEVTVVAVDEEAIRRAASRWWVLAIMGALTAILGVIVIARPVAGEFALALFIALALAVSGIGDIAAAGRWPRPWVAALWGALSLVAAVVTVAWPAITLTVLAVLIGIVLIVRGLVAALGALAVRPYLWGLWLAIGIVEVAVGVGAIAWPGITILVLAIIIGIDLLIAGVIELVVAFRLRALR